MTIGRRDDARLAAGLGHWFAARHPERPQARVLRIDRPKTGWSNETLLVTFVWVDGDGGEESLVVRLPPLVASFPSDELGAQAAVQRALGDAGIRVAAPVVVERDARWVGAPFLVMHRVPGRAIGESPSLDEALMGAGEEAQRGVHDTFFATLAAVHKVDWRRAGLDGCLRSGGLASEVAWWVDYVDWAADGSPAPTLRRVASWCAASVPPEPEPSLCWGDARLGNVLFDDRWLLTAALDWELASIGPAEMDLAWYLANDELNVRFAGRSVPGFHDRETAVLTYERRLGRAVEHLRWHELFALVRAAAINDRQARIATAAGIDYPGIAGEGNPLLRHIARRAERYEPGT